MNFGGRGQCGFSLDSREEDLIRRYFEAFNKHDLKGVIACSHSEPVVVDSEGRRHEGVDAVRRLYRFQFSLAADGRCDLRSLVGHNGRGMAESLFRGTVDRDGTAINALGAEVFEFADERIKEIRDHHRVLN
jgi:ketosteroid isomerase-like protein